MHDPSRIEASELEALRIAIQASGESMERIAERASVKARWLRTFVAGAIPEPGFTKIRRVQRALDAVQEATP